MSDSDKYKKERKKKQGTEIDRVAGGNFKWGVQGIPFEEGSI